MKHSPQDIARALVDLCSEIPETEHASVCDAAVEMLLGSGLGKELRTFPRLVAAEIKKKENVLSGSVTLPSESAPDLKGELSLVVERSLRKKLDLTNVIDPKILGGALLRIEDERFDSSLSGALSSLKDHLIAPTAA